MSLFSWTHFFYTPIHQLNVIPKSLWYLLSTSLFLCKHLHCVFPSLIIYLVFGLWVTSYSPEPFEDTVRFFLHLVSVIKKNWCKWHPSPRRGFLYWVWSGIFLMSLYSPVSLQCFWMTNSITDQHGSILAILYWSHTYLQSSLGQLVQFSQMHTKVLSLQRAILSNYR
jgi:hypothetical protein